MATGRIWTKGLIALLVLDIVLVVTLIVLVVTTSTPDAGAADDPSATSSGSAAPSGSAEPSAQSVGNGLPEFRLPSGNIHCTMSDEAATCQIASITFDPPDADCDGTSGHEFVLTTAGVDVPCVEGGGPAVAPDSMAVLDYGRSSTVGPFTCASATDGVTCVHDESGTGFTLARAAWSELP